ncbi:WSC domain-containing protein [Biscogniauxia marginata]|nr:WSC domain-containing protein [Biscogniauxia marginata]
MHWYRLSLGTMLSLGILANADPTWPSPNDELEEIMYQVSGYRARQFGGTVIPCSSQASGPGRHNAAEWLRAAFHDMATTTNLNNVRAGGLDGSLQYELLSSDNLGPGFNTTLKFMADYYTSRSSVADLIALGVYYAVRSCGGPVVPISGGRIDAVSAGPIGVPLPQNTAYTFEQQYLRMGFTRAEMIQSVACGHTIGGVHETEFPQIVPVGSTANGEAPTDSTVDVFDNKVVTEYIAGNTTNPLVVGPSIRATRNSDFKVFNYDSNVTVKAMADPTQFNNVCSVVLRKMIDTVPAGVVLSDPIQPYLVKPVNMQLALNSGATTMQLTGFIRILTTNLGGDSVSSLVLNYKDRSGGTNCGSSGCKYTASLLGATQGFDDTFVWFPINAVISTSTGISSFTVTLNMASGTTKDYDNNGNSYPMQDAIILQKPQSCLLSGTLTATAAVRNDRNSLPVNMYLSYKQSTGNPNLPIPTLKNTTISMTKGTCVGPYTFYTANFTSLGDLDYATKIDVVSGSDTSALRDDFNAASELAGTCLSFQNPPASLCTTGQTSTTPGSSSTSSSVITTSSSTTSSSTSSSSVISSTSSVTSSSTTSSSTGPVETLHHRETLGGYRLVGCQAESTAQGTRALGGGSFAYDTMTLESCMSNCTGYVYWGTEYGRECYCGNSLHSTSETAALADCNMACAGDSTQYCGAGNRIELYSTTASQSTPTATLAPKPTVSSYVRVGCYNEVSGRALKEASYADDAMTLELCASNCASFTYWATEYGRECYCGNTLDVLSTPAPDEECNMVCAGNQYEYCGAGDRLELYEKATVSSSISAALTSSSTISASSVPSSSSSSLISSPISDSSSTTISDLATTSSLTSSLNTATTSSSATVSSTQYKPTVSAYTLMGCWTEGDGVRALSAKATSSGDSMTLELCADFCEEYHYFGAEYGSECYCGNVPDASSNETSLSDCSMTCTGDQLEYCGAANRLVLYYSNTTNGPSQPVTVGNYTWFGCQTETAESGLRALAAKSYTAANMTLDACASFCDGSAYFGAEYGSECYCGDDLTQGSNNVTATDCNMACGGNKKQLCGAGNRLSVYEKAES